MEIQVHPGQGCNVNNGAPSKMLPGTAPHIDMTEVTCLCENIRGVASRNCLQDDAVQPCAAVKNLHDDTYQYHHRDEVRQRHDGLHHLLEAGTLHTIEQQRKAYGYHGIDHQAVQWQNQGISDNPGKLIGFKKINTYIKTKFVSKKKNINLTGFSIEKVKIDNINSYVNAILSIFKNNISTINHIYRDQEFIRLNILQYLSCDDEVYVLKDSNNNILGYAFYEKDQNYIREIFTINNLFFDIFINHILLDLHINNVKCNILSKKDSNYLALGYKLESYDLFLNLLFD